MERSRIAEFDDLRLVAVYDSVNAYAPGTQPDFCLQLAAELGARAIVDLGCGTGLVTCALARAGYELTGIDPAPGMLAIARTAPAVNGCVGSTVTPPTCRRRER